MCLIVLCEQASFSGVPNFREVTKSWPQKFFVLLRLILNCLEKETVSKYGFQEEYKHIYVFKL